MSATSKEIGMNAKIENGKLCIEIDLPDPKSAPVSKSGKSRILASTGGFMAVGEHKGQAVSLSLNCITKL